MSAFFPWISSRILISPCRVTEDQDDTLEQGPNPDGSQPTSPTRSPPVEDIIQEQSDPVPVVPSRPKRTHAEATDYEENSENEESDGEEAARHQKKIKVAKVQAQSAADQRKEAAAKKKEAAARKKLEQAERALAKAQKEMTSGAVAKTRNGRKSKR
jgi:hypothetical protein